VNKRSHGDIFACCIKSNLSCTWGIKTKSLFFTTSFPLLSSSSSIPLSPCTSRALFLLHAFTLNSLLRLFRLLGLMPDNNVSRELLCESVHVCMSRVFTSSVPPLPPPPLQIVSSLPPSCFLCLSLPSPLELFYRKKLKRLFFPPDV